MIEYLIPNLEIYELKFIGNRKLVSKINPAPCLEGIPSTNLWYWVLDLVKRISVGN